MADTKILSTGIPHKSLPDKYIRPENERPNLSQVSDCDDVPVIDLDAQDRSQTLLQVSNACKNYGFLQVVNHGVPKELTEQMQKVAREFFNLPVEEKMKLYSDDPTKTMRLSTSFNVNKEEVHNWRDYLRLHCWPLHQYVPEMPSNPPSFKSFDEDPLLPTIPTLLEHDGPNFHLWDECPPLYDEDAWKWKPLQSIQLHSLLNYETIDYNLDDKDAQYLLTDILNDQSLHTVVAEGFAMPKHGENNKPKVEVEENNNEDDDDDEEGFIRRIKGNDSKVTKNIDYEEINKYFDMPISKAAKELNVGITLLKKRCRELGIKRWPHRKIKSLEGLISNVKELGMVNMVEHLEEHKQKIHLMPELEFTEDTKKLRQRCFKANYKKRRANLGLTHF